MGLIAGMLHGRGGNLGKGWDWGVDADACWAREGERVRTAALISDSAFGSESPADSMGSVLREDSVGKGIHFGGEGSIL